MSQIERLEEEWREALGRVGAVLAAVATGDAAPQAAALGQSLAQLRKSIQDCTELDLNPEDIQEENQQLKKTLDALHAEREQLVSKLAYARRILEEPSAPFSEGSD